MGISGAAFQGRVEPDRYAALIAIEDEKNPVTVKTVSQLRQQLELAGILEKCTAAEDEEDALRKFVSHEFEGDSAREDEGNVRIIKEAEERYRQSYGNIGSFFKRIF